MTQPDLRPHLSGHTTRMGKKKVMIADDDPAILDVVSMILQDAGYDVETTAGTDTEKQVLEYMPDVLLLDIWMSGMDGRTVCTNLKKQKNTMHIPVVMISAHRFIKRIARLSGADDFITKPFEMDAVLAKVKKYAYA